MRAEYLSIDRDKPVNIRDVLAPLEDIDAKAQDIEVVAIPMIAEGGDQQHRSIGEWQRLCRESQARADQARAHARRSRWQKFRSRGPELLILILLTVWAGIVVFSALHALT